MSATPTAVISPEASVRHHQAASLSQSAQLLAVGRLKVEGLALAIGTGHRELGLDLGVRSLRNRLAGCGHRGNGFAGRSGRGGAAGSRRRAAAHQQAGRQCGRCRSETNTIHDLHKKNAPWSYFYMCRTCSAYHIIRRGKLQEEAFDVLTISPNSIEWDQKRITVASNCSSAITGSQHKSRRAAFWTAQRPFCLI